MIVFKLSIETITYSTQQLIRKFQVGSASHSSRVNVYGLPYVRPMKKRPVVAGDNLIVHCPVAGYPIDSIVWERDNRLILFYFRTRKLFYLEVYCSRFAKQL